MKTVILSTLALRIAPLVAIFALTGCGFGQTVLNPFHEDPSPVAYLGSPNDHALNESSAQIDSARAALENTGSYQRAHMPEPVNPVINPAVVRLMWIPDHLNKSGDLVPSHYYYVKVKKDDWAVTDAFELEGQLNGSTGGATSALPFQYENDRNN